MSVAGEQSREHYSNDDFALTSPGISPLRAIPGFERLTQKKLYPKGSTLFVEGHPACGVFVLRDGRVKLSIASAEGKTLIVRIARPGDLLGIHSTLTGHAYEATAVTLMPCRVDFISRQNLLSLIDRESLSGSSLAIAISKEFTDLVEHARVLFLSTSAAERLAGLLSAWGDTFGQVTNFGIRLQTLLTHDELGQLIGASRETVTRALSGLKRRKIIRTTNGDLWIQNRRALAAIARGKG